MPNVIYDIRTTEYAQQTLTNLTGIPIPVWEQYLKYKHKYEYPDDLVAAVVNAHGHLPHSYRDFVFVYFHVTTSANNCASIREYGILDLQQSYLCRGSELRAFLENHDIHIDLYERMLTYRGQGFDITFGPHSQQDKEAYKRRSIGRKFYFDYAICGFLSVRMRTPYGGKVHHRPEILLNIDNLLGLNLSQEWMLTHTAYEIVARVSGGQIVYDSNDDQSEEEKVLNYLTKAYLAAFGKRTEKVVQIRNHVQIPPPDILKIRPIEYWKDD